MQLLIIDTYSLKFLWLNYMVLGCCFKVADDSNSDVAVRFWTSSDLFPELDINSDHCIELLQDKPEFVSR